MATNPPARSAPSSVGAADPMAVFNDLPPATRAAIEAHVRKQVADQVSVAHEREIRTKVAGEIAVKIQKILDFAVKVAPATMFQVLKAECMDAVSEKDMAAVRDDAKALATNTEIGVAFEQQDGSFRFKTLFSSLIRAACNRVLLVAPSAPGSKKVGAIALKDVSPLVSAGLVGLPASERAARVSDAIGSRAPAGSD